MCTVPRLPDFIPCPSCKGVGSFELLSESSHGCGPHYEDVSCDNCRGGGWITERDIAWNKWDATYRHWMFSPTQVEQWKVRFIVPLGLAGFVLGVGGLFSLIMVANDSGLSSGFISLPLGELSLGSIFWFARFRRSRREDALFEKISLEWKAQHPEPDKGPFSPCKIY